MAERPNHSGSPPTGGTGSSNLWPGIVLSVLLVCFLASFVYAAYAVYQWARLAVSQTPELTPVTVTTEIAEEFGPQPQFQVTPEPTSVPVPAETWDARGQGRVNILLLGVDQRPSETSPPRTDTMIVVTFDPQTGQAGMLSIPRDLWVRIPVYDVFAKINTAYTVGEKHGYPGGGPALAKRTVSDLVGYPIHYYVKVNFDGFRRFIDLIGGIDIYVEQDINDPLFPDDNYGYDPLFIPAGQHHMDGELALKYARTRHVDDDFQRARRQQQVLLAIKERILQANMIPTLIVRLPQLMRTFSGSVETDIPLDKAVAMANIVRQLDLEHVQQVVIDRSLGEERNDPTIGYVLIPNRDAIRPLMDQLFGGNPGTPELASPPQAPTPAAANALAAENARVSVLDGVGDPALAQWTAEWLKAQGVQIIDVDTADRQDYQHTIIRIYRRKPETLQVIQQLIRQAEIQDLSGAVASAPLDIEIVIGPDFSPPVGGQ